MPFTLNQLPMTSKFDLLFSGLEELAISLTPEQTEQLIKYAELLVKWNKVYKLTAISTTRELIIRHLLDGLSIVKYFALAPTILDVGSGMGVPGIILAITCPNSAVCVLDSNSKKTAFLRQVKIELGLENLEVVTQRVEEYVPTELFTLITSRAFANLGLFVELTGHLLARTGCFLAMKSTQGIIESSALSGWHSQAIPLTVPNLSAQRFLIKMSRL